MGLLDLFNGGQQPQAGLPPSPEPASPDSQFDPLFDQASKETGIPVAILKAQAKQESWFNPNAVGKAGEVGLFQIMPSTAAQPGYGVEPLDPARLSDPGENVRFGARYLAARARHAGVENWNDPEQVAKGLTAYNGGGDPNYAQNVFRHLRPPGQAEPSVPPPPAASAWGGPAPQAAAPQAQRPFAVSDISHLGQFNFGRMEKPEGIVIHHTGGRGTPEGIMNVFKQRGLAAQFIMDREGNVFRALPEGAKGRHLRPSEINGLSNSNALGIEIIAKDDSDLTDKQRASAAKWLAATQSQYGIPAANVFGHGEVNSHKQRTEGSSIVSAWRAANGIEGLPAVNVARSQPSSQLLNPTITAAAERGRGPAADRPARGSAMTIGQMPMAPRQMADTTSPDNAGVLEFLRQQAGQGQEAPPAIPQQSQGGLGGLGGMRAQAPAPAPAGVESLLPSNRPNPLAFFGKPAMENQQADAERQGKIALVKELMGRGIPAAEAVGLINNPAALKLRMDTIGQEKTAAANKEAVGALTGGVPNPMTEPSLGEANKTERAKIANLLGVIANPSVSDGVRDVAKLEYQRQLKSVTNKYGLQPIYGVDKDGNPVIMQMSESGTAGQTKLPEGVTISKAPIKVDTGTGTVFLDPITRQPVANVPKDIAGAEAAKIAGKAQGEAVTDLPGAIAKSDQMLGAIDAVRNHPGRNSFGATGWGSQLPVVGDGVPGSRGRDFVALVDQLKGKSFLEAFESLKGGGQITEVEGQKATQAIARLDRAQSKEGFDAALNDLEAVVRGASSRARQKAGGAAAQGASRPNGLSPPTPGEPPPKIFTKAEYDKLSPGAEYQDAEGNVRRKGGN